MNNSRYLAHHGVKGQQWGVRNGPPYPIEDKILRKGTKLNSVSGIYNDSKEYRRNGRPMYTYRDDEEWDNKVYKGPFSVYLANYRGQNFIREHKYEVVKDLRMPTKQERINEFNNLLEDKKYGDKLIKDILNIRDICVKYDIAMSSDKNTKQLKKLTKDNIKSKEYFNTVYELFNHVMEETQYSKSAREYINRMSKKYDAMVDDNNQGKYNNAHDPIIIFNTKKYLKELSRYGKIVFQDEIDKNYSDVKFELKKENKYVKL